MAHGPIPAGYVIAHLCDVRNCVRIDHLKMTTQPENVRDAVKKGTHRPPTPKRITSGMAELIRVRIARGEKQIDVAASMGLSQSTISVIVNRKRRWAHVAD